ncbi:unnamed protein product, partial [Gongylonema pulchrum]|uniref:Uncharacterized protein n=1 Tax=Gongylonema pulchrum TaxID=637853 RepID=A0A183D6T9_9BILA
MDIHHQPGASNLRIVVVWTLETIRPISAHIFSKRYQPIRTNLGHSDRDDDHGDDDDADGD